MPSKKASLDYISLERDWINSRDNKRIRRAVEETHPGQGWGATYVMLGLFTYISTSKWGYYVKSDPEIFADISEEIHAPEELIRTTIECAVEKDIIDKQLYAQGIITSKDFQERYIDAMERMRRVINIEDMPYYLSDNDGKFLHYANNPQNNTEDCNNLRQSVADCNRPPKNVEKCGGLPQPETDCNILPQDADICVYNKIKENIRKGGEKSAPAHTRVGECTHPTPPPIFFENQKLQKLWENLLKQPLWAEKTPEALEIAAKTLAEYDSFIAMEMISHTIGAGLREIFPPKEEMFAVAKRKRDAYNKKHPASPTTPPVNDETEFKFLSTPQSERAKELLNKWSEIINLLPVELKERATATKFEFKDEGTCVSAPSEIHEFIESKILEKVKSILQSFDPKIKLFYI